MRLILRSRIALALAIVATVAPCGAAEPRPASPGNGDAETLAQEVARTERAFAATMAERDHDAFRTFLADDAVFLAADRVLRGKDVVAEAWKPYFSSPVAAFSWEPETVEVLDSGDLALSTGPVHDARGVRVGTFTSVWRREASGEWRVVFDHGCPACPGPGDPADEDPAEGDP